MADFVLCPSALKSHSGGMETRVFMVAEDDITFKLTICFKSLPLNNTGFCSVIQALKLVLGSLLAKITFCPILNKKCCILSDGDYRRSGPSAAKMQLKRRIRHCPVACG